MIFYENERKYFSRKIFLEKAMGNIDPRRSHPLGCEQFTHLLQKCKFKYMLFNKKINVLIVGSKGQLGSFLFDFFRKQSFMKKSKFGQIFCIDKDELDICNRDAVFNFFNQSVYDPPIKFDYVINCAAATDTTAIENDPNSFYAINVLGAKHLAETCMYNHIKFIHISTDYVFSEYSDNSEIYSPEPFPINQYGLQKLLAEKFIETIYANQPKGYLIARSSWMFGNSKKSFIEKLLSNIVKEYVKCISNKNLDQSMSINVVNDCFGRPTHVAFIADFLKNAILDDLYGIHNCQPIASQISRYDWANIIVDLAKYKFTHGADRTNAKAILDSVSILPIDSKNLKGMRHPGKVISFNEKELNKDDIYTFKYWTSIYINDNKDALMRFMEDEYSKELNKVNCK